VTSPQLLIVIVQLQMRNAGTWLSSINIFFFKKNVLENARATLPAPEVSDKETRVHTKLYVINYLSSTTQVHDFKMYTDIQT
jgi:hypothetical protein